MPHVPKGGRQKTKHLQKFPVDRLDDGSINQAVKPRHARNENAGNDAPHETTALFPGHDSKEILVMIQHFSNLDTLHIDCGLLESFPVEYAASLWSAIASAMKGIVISARTAALENLLPPPYIKLPSLTSLCITINHKTNSLEDEPGFLDMQLSMASFVNSVQNTLHSLSVSATPPHDLPIFFDKLERFPHLTALDIDLTLMSFMFPNKLPISFPSPDFVLRHQDTIQHFSVTASRLAAFRRTPDMVKWDSVYEYKMPKLQFFSIGSNMLTARPGRFRRFLKQHVSFLQSLEIVGFVSPQELGKLLNLLDQQPHGAVLTKLSISIYRLDLHLMLKLMKQLPALKILKLRIKKIGKETGFGFTPGQYFPLRLVSSLKFVSSVAN